MTVQLAPLTDVVLFALLLVGVGLAAWLVLRGIGEAGAGVGAGLGSILGGLGGALGGLGAGIGSAISGTLGGLGSGISDALRGASSLLPRGGGTRGPMEKRSHTISAPGPSRLGGFARRAAGRAREAWQTARWSAGGAAAPVTGGGLVALDVGAEGPQIVAALAEAGLVAQLDGARLIMPEAQLEAAVAALDAAGYAMRDELGVEKINEGTIEGEVLNV